MYLINNVKKMAQPPDEPAGMAENGGQFAISRETDKAAGNPNKFSEIRPVSNSK